MSGSSSSPTNTTSTTTSASETNLAATNTQGVTLVGNKGTTTLANNTNNISTDQGAVKAGQAIATAAITGTDAITSKALDIASSFGEHALDEISASQTQSASLVQNFLSQGSSELNQTTAAFAQIEESNSEANNAQLGNIATTLANIANANDTTQASQSTEFAKVALIVGATVAVALALIFASRR